MFKNINSEALTRTLLTASLGAVITLAVLAPAAWKIKQALPPHIATVDLSALLSEEEARFSAKVTPTMTDADRKAMTDGVAAFGKKLSDETAKLSEECECVLINKAALLGYHQVEDLTSTLRARVVK